MKSTIDVKIKDGHTVGTAGPKHCIRCGAEAVLTHEQGVRAPQMALWAYPITGMLIAEILELKARMEVPLCKKHDPKKAAMPSLAPFLADGHGASKLLIACLVLPITLVSLIVIGYATFGDSKNPGEDASIGVGFLTIGTLIGFFLVRLIKSKMYHPKKLDETTIQLIGVSEEYADDFRAAIAHEQQRLPSREAEKITIVQQSSYSPPPTSPFTFACPHCDQHISTTADMISSEGQCPSCNQTFIVPQPPS